MATTALAIDEKIAAIKDRETAVDAQVKALRSEQRTLYEEGMDFLFATFPALESVSWCYRTSEYDDQGPDGGLSPMYVFNGDAETIADCYNFESGVYTPLEQAWAAACDRLFGPLDSFFQANDDDGIYTRRRDGEHGYVYWE